MVRMPRDPHPSPTVLTHYTTTQHEQKRVAKDNPEHADDTNTIDRRDHLRCHSCIEDFCCILNQWKTTKEIHAKS